MIRENDRVMDEDLDVLHDAAQATHAVVTTAHRRLDRLVIDTAADGDGTTDGGEDGFWRLR